MKVFKAPDGYTQLDPSKSNDVAGQRLPPGWLLVAKDTDILALGITISIVADPNPSAPPSGILMMGDSITAYGDTSPSAWTSILSYTPIFNGGVPSDTTTGMLSRLPLLLTNNRPKAMFLLGGVNDISLGIPAATTLSNIKAMLAMAQAAGVMAFTQAILPLAASYSGSVTNAAINALNPQIKSAVGSVANGAWIDWGSVLVAGDYKADGIHPAASGYAKWATAIAAFVNLYR